MLAARLYVVMSLNHNHNHISQQLLAVMTFQTDIHGCQRMNLNDFDPLRISSSANQELEFSTCITLNDKIHLK